MARNSRPSSGHQIDSINPPTPAVGPAGGVRQPSEAEQSGRVEREGFLQLGEVESQKVLARGFFADPDPTDLGDVAASDLARLAEIGLDDSHTGSVAERLLDRERLIEERLVDGSLDALLTSATGNPPLLTIIKDLGLSVPQLAKKMGVTRMTVYNAVNLTKRQSAKRWRKRLLMAAFKILEIGPVEGFRRVKELQRARYRAALERTESE